MTTKTPTPSGLDMAALIARCEQTHLQGIAEVRSRSLALGEALVRAIAAGDASRDDFELALSYASVPEPEEPADRFAARRSGFYQGLMAGICFVSAR